MDNLSYRNGVYTLNNNKSSKIIEELTPGNCYLLNHDAVYDFYFLTDTETLQIPSKVFGDKSYLNRFLTKYQKQDKNLGVLLTGIKGDGKSVDAKLLALASEQPIIIINAGFNCQKFLEFMSNPVFNNCTIFVDEYEKLYETNVDRFGNANANGNVNILKLLDGYSNNKNLFIFTSNTLSISKYLLNRPSRLRYVKNYGGIDKGTLTDIVNHYIKDSEKAVAVIEHLNSFPLLTIDIVKEILVEIVDLDITVEEALLYFNFSAKVKSYSVRAFIYEGKDQTKLLGESSLFRDRSLNDIIKGFNNLGFYTESKYALDFFEDTDCVDTDIPTTEATIEQIKNGVNRTELDFAFTEMVSMLNKTVYVHYKFIPSDLGAYLSAF
jgi:SpoVK/Ycf46/Vps4 family AAA+-type ATPase